MPIKNKYYVYRHIRLDKNEPFYIGIGTKPKKFTVYKMEYCRAFQKYGRSLLWKKITNKSKYKVEIMFESKNLKLIRKKETELIKLYGRKNLRTGILCNLTDGGELNNNRIISEKTKSKQSKTRKLLFKLGKIPEGCKRNWFKKGQNLYPVNWTEKLRKEMSNTKKKFYKQNGIPENSKKTLFKKNQPAHNAREVLDLTTGIYYNSISEVSLAKNIDPRNIYKNTNTFLILK